MFTILSNVQYIVLLHVTHVHDQYPEQLLFSLSCLPSHIVFIQLLIATTYMKLEI